MKLLDAWGVPGVAGLALSGIRQLKVAPSKQANILFILPDDHAGSWPRWGAAAFFFISRAILWVFLTAFVCVADAQILRVPSRPADAPSGSAFARSISSLPLPERESRIEMEVLRGNVPDFLRRFQPFTIRRVTAVGVTNAVELFVAPDYLCIGSDADYFLTPMTPRTAQRIADATACSLPTPGMVDAIYAAAEVKLEPGPIPPGPAMTTVEVFAQHNDMVRTQRAERLAAWPLGTLVAGHKKDVVLSNRLTNAPGKVAIYGWHRADGKPIQPLYTGHVDSWVDYSHGIRLVHSVVAVNGRPRPLAEVLRDPEVCALLNDEVPMANLRYPTNRLVAGAEPPAQRPAVPAKLIWSTNAEFGERAVTFQLLPDVRVQINEPLALASAPAGATVALVLYALPNGNTIEQTAGRKLRPGEDWHFDIQHIAAQTRFVRAEDRNRIWVAAYLEAGQKSWPAWRKAHVGKPLFIPALVEALARRYAGYDLRVTLSGHSGGGSFIFGYFNSVEAIPDSIERVAFLDANYAYDPAQGHTEKLARWLKSSDHRRLTVLAYNDAVALLDGKSFVSATGGTWHRSHLMKTNLSAHFEFSSRVTNGVEVATALSGRVQLLLKDNPERRIFHTVQVERNGFIHALLAGTALEGRGYTYLGRRAYESWIEAPTVP